MLALMPAAVSPAPNARRLMAVWGRVVALFEFRGASFALLLLLQVKVMGGYWEHREVTAGDTASYFSAAWRWYDKGEEVIAWSPAYTAFYGSFLFLTSDPAAATLAHRLAIVTAANLLVLALFRRLLPPGLAWLCAAWWTCLPITFNTKYEVHLFAVLPVFTCWLLLLTAAGPWRRAAALGVLTAAAGLVRNELAVPAAVLGLVLGVWEWRAARCDAAGRWHGLRRAAVAYAASVAAVGLLGLAAYERSHVKYPELGKMMRTKHTFNMAQVYAFGYLQRHPDWAGDPWLGGFGLMKETFGSSDVSFGEMIRANPRAVCEHVAWNLSLTPSGLQLLLFNRSSGSVNPDYDKQVERCLRHTWAALALGGLLALWGLGSVYLWRNRQRWWSEWLSARALGWAGMFAVAVVVPLIIASQRPRPSYLLAFGAALIAATGMAAYAVAVRWRGTSVVRHGAPAIAAALLLFVPGFYRGSYASTHPDLAGNVIRRMAAYRDEIRAGANLLVPELPFGLLVFPTACIPDPGFDDDRWRPNPAAPTPRGAIYELPGILDRRPAGESFPASLDRLAIDFVYLDETSLRLLEALPEKDAAAGFVKAGEMPGWRLLDGGDTAGDRWRLYARAGAPSRVR